MDNITPAVFSGSNQSNPAKVSFKDSELQPLVGQDSKLVSVDKHGRPICVYVHTVLDINQPSNSFEVRSANNLIIILAVREHEVSI